MKGSCFFLLPLVPLGGREEGSDPAPECREVDSLLTPETFPSQNHCCQWLTTYSPSYGFHLLSPNYDKEQAGMWSCRAESAL